MDDRGPYGQCFISPRPCHEQRHHAIAELRILHFWMVVDPPSSMALGLVMNAARSHYDDASDLWMAHTRQLWPSALS